MLLAIALMPFSVRLSLQIYPSAAGLGLYLDFPDRQRCFQRFLRFFEPLFFAALSPELGWPIETRCARRSALPIGVANGSEELLTVKRFPADFFSFSIKRLYNSSLKISLFAARPLSSSPRSSLLGAPASIPRRATAMQSESIP